MGLFFMLKQETGPDTLQPMGRKLLNFGIPGTGWHNYNYRDAEVATTAVQAIDGGLGALAALLYDLKIAVRREGGRQ